VGEEGTLNMQDVKKFLDAFLDSPNSGVIAIKGDWGAGKTYFVTHYLQDRPAIASKLVSFVSLFGLSDIEEIRRRVFPSAISAKKLKEGKKAGWLQRSLGLARKLPKISDFETALQALEDYYTRDLLIVFDDVERKADSLSLKNFLGLVNFLSEHANCKVIIILNEDQLADDDKKELGIFREKLIDREVLFAPSYLDNAKLFFHDPKLFDRALDVFTRAECRNLRVINKCHLAVKEFERELSALDAWRQQAILEQVIVLACLFYQFGGRVDFSKLQSFYFQSLFTKGEEKETEDAQILKKIGYISKDFDEVIISYLQTGLFDPKALTPVVETQAAKGQRDDLEREEQEIYKLLWANFRGTGEEFCEKMSRFLDHNQERLNWDEILQASKALQATGFKGDIHKWADAFILRNAPNFSFEQCNNFSLAAHSVESKKAIRDRLKSLLKQRSPKDIIYAMFKNSGWNPEDTAVLNEYSVDEYVKWLREEDDENLLHMLQNFVQTFNPKQSTPEWKSIGEKVFAAFRILCRGNSFVRHKLINNVRVAPELLDEPVLDSPQQQE
jgi:hypothetical protein